ncbi:MAG: hypothetical protein HY644_02820 [Acidobacteria bacterium]|nr:hypothetical protein [Acidobacteriota bacterium]
MIDHVTVYCRGRFETSEIDALRRLLRIRQRGGRPDLLVTPTFVGRETEFSPWQTKSGEEPPRRFVSATPYFCPVHLSHGKKSGGQARSIRAEIIKGLVQQAIVTDESDVEAVEELVFDYAPDEFAVVRQQVDARQLREPVPPRQYFPVIDPPANFPPLPRLNDLSDPRSTNVLLKNPDADPG